MNTANAGGYTRTKIPADAWQGRVGWVSENAPKPTPTPFILTGTVVLRMVLIPPIQAELSAHVDPEARWRGYR